MQILDTFESKNVQSQVGWVEGSQEPEYFILISAQTLFLVLSHTFHCFQTHFKPRTCECRDLKEISGELVGWKDPTNPNPLTNKPDISFRSLHEHCSWLYLIPFIVFRLI